MVQGQARSQDISGGDVVAPEAWRWVCDTAERTVEALGTSLWIRVYGPGMGSEDGLLTAIAAVRAFRAEIYYAGGRRPSFRAPDGRFVDPDDADLRAYHIVCRDGDGVLVGCLRAAPAEVLSASPVEAHLGPAGTAELISELGIDRTGLLEGGRLAVTATRRRHGVAAALMMVTLALGRHTGRPVIWGTAGEGEGQYKFFTRFGYRVVPGSSAYVPRYDENLCVVVHDQRAAALPVAEAIRMVERPVFGADSEGVTAEAQASPIRPSSRPPR
jgi:GNAT superfamily N-acetyltransferase